MKILVTGTTGLLGHLIAEQLLNTPHSVRVTVRKFALLEAHKKKFGDALTMDLTNPESLAESVQGVDVVIHCAGLVGSGRGAADEYMRINAEGTRALAAAAKKAGVKRFVFMSTVGVYGTNTMKPYIDEQMPYAKSTAYTTSKIEAEKSLIASGIPYTILRPYWITGPGDRFLIPSIARLLRADTFSFIGKGDQQWSLSAAENIADAAITAALHPAAENQVYNVADTIVKIADTVQVIAEALNLPMPQRRRAALWVFFGSVFDQSPENLARMSVDLFFPLWRGLTINAEKIRRELGWQPKVDWRDSVRRGALEWLAQNPR